MTELPVHRTYDNSSWAVSRFRWVLVLFVLLSVVCNPTVARASALSKAAAAADAIAKEAVTIKVYHDHDAATKAQTLARMRSKRVISCSVYSSLVLQQAGCLPVGVICKHTPNASGKETLAECISNTNRLRECKIYRVNKTYAKMNAKFKKKGVVYVYPSNVAVCAGSGYIYTFNSGARPYQKMSTVKRKSGYVFVAPILYAIVPN